MFSNVSRSLLWRGILAIIIGVVSVAWPSITVGAFVIIFAIFAFTTAIIDASRAFSQEKAGPVFGYLLLSLLSVAAGVVALVWPQITALALTICIAIWAIATGILEVALAFRRNEEAGERAMWALGGLISIALGVVLAIRPDIGALSLATVFGLFSIVIGVYALVLSARTHRIAGRTERFAHSAG